MTDETKQQAASVQEAPPLTLEERVTQMEGRLAGLDSASDVVRRLEKVEAWYFAKKEYLTFEEACEYLGISKSKLYKMTSSFSIPCYKPEGRMLYFNREELNAWLSKNPVKTSRTHEQDAIKYVMDKPLKL